MKSEILRDVSASVYRISVWISSVRGPGCTDDFIFPTKVWSELGRTGELWNENNALQTQTRRRETLPLTQTRR